MTKLTTDHPLFHPYSDYVDRDTAVANNLTYGGGNTFILRADSTQKVAPGERGRKSVRLVSTETFRHHVAVYVNSTPGHNGSAADFISRHPQLRCEAHATGLCYVACHLGDRSG